MNKMDSYLKNWFDQLKAPRTLKNYKRQFPVFLEWIKKTPTEIIESRFEHLTTRDLSKRRYWEIQLVKFTRYLETLKDDKGKRKLGIWAIRSYQKCVQSFFSHNGSRLIFTRNELAIEPSEREKIIKEWIPLNEECRVLYRACRSARDRSVLLVLYQSGFSPIDVSNLKIENLDLYDQNGNWRKEPFKDVYIAKLREKSNILQQTAISREAIEDIRISLMNRGYPKEGFLFESRKGEQFTPRFINDMLKATVKKHFPEKAKLWKTKNLRDSFMNGCLQANITQELKDALVGHQRQSARKDYKLTEETILQAYNRAFKFLSVNGVGSSTRKIEQIEQDFKETKSELAQAIAELRTQNKQLEKALNTQFIKTMKAVKLLLAKKGIEFKEET